MKAGLYRDAARALASLAKAQEASEKACDARGPLPAGSSRARVTTANARWARAAEDRDRCLDRARAALADAGLDPFVPGRAP